MFGFYCLIILLLQLACFNHPNDITSRLLLAEDGINHDLSNLTLVGPETQAKLEALLEAAGQFLMQFVHTETGNSQFSLRVSCCWGVAVTEQKFYYFNRSQKSKCLCSQGERGAILLFSPNNHSTRNLGWLVIYFFSPGSFGIEVTVNKRLNTTNNANNPALVWALFSPVIIESKLIFFVLHHIFLHQKLLGNNYLIFVLPFQNLYMALMICVVLKLLKVFDINRN